MRNLTILLLLLLAAAPASALDRIRCGARLVGTDARADEVRSVCGEPDFVDRWEVQPYGLPYPQLADTEQWYYNFGPSQLMRVLRFQRGRLVEIDTDTYGFAESAPGPCGPYDIAEGLNKFRLLSACGPPASRRYSYTLAPARRFGGIGLRHPGHAQALVQVYLEEWVYNFGPRHLMRVVTLQNGVVTDVQSEGRGY